MSQANRRTDPRRNRRKDAARFARIVAAGLLCALGCFASACKLHSAAIEKLGDIGSLNDAGSGREAGGAATSAPSPSADGAASPGKSPPGATGSRGGTAGADAAPVPQDSGAGAGPSGQKGASRTDAAADAGSRSTDDAGDGQQSVDDVTCAFDYSACLLLDPLSYAECTRMSAERCGLFGGKSGTAADGGAQPSEACVLEEAECIMNNPADVVTCTAMLNACTK